MKQKIYYGIQNEPRGGMTPTANIIRDAWVFGLLPEDETCEGWTIQGIEELYDKVMGVNLKGPFRLSALTGTHMAAHGGGSILFVSSIASHRPSPNELVYGAAKAGVNNLTYGLARTFGPSVRVNCIVPGPFLTDISKAWDARMVQHMEATSALLSV